jgi:hypothetical protein
MARRMKGQRPYLITPRQSGSRTPGQADYARELPGARFGSVVSRRLTLSKTLSPFASGRVANMRLPRCRDGDN